MIVKITDKAPKLSDLLQTLRNRYSDRYAVSMFEFGQPSIIVKKSFWVGAQITIRKKEIDLNFTYPSLISGVLGATLLYIGAFSNLIRSWYSLERELGTFLRKQYG